MAQNLTNIHKKLDRLTERLTALDTRQMSDARRQDARLLLLHKIVEENSRANRIAEDNARASLERITLISQDTARMAHETSVMAAEAMRAAKDADERIARLASQRLQ